MKKIIILALSAIFMTGCVAPKSYVDPNFGKATYADVKNVEKQYNTQVTVEFQRNGEKFKAANQEVLNHVERTLRATRVVTPSKVETDYSIKVTVNNLADMDEAVAKGFGTGLTFGAVGSTVTDYYEVTIEYIDKSGTSVSKNYKHALHTTIGNEKAPFDSVMPTTPSDAFGTVVEQVLLNFIVEMQKDDKFTLLNGLMFKHA
jgi:hypothetical protein